jgi:hypothetical protein
VHVRALFRALSGISGQKNVFISNMEQRGLNCWTMLDWNFEHAAPVKVIDASGDGGGDDLQKRINVLKQSLSSPGGEIKLPFAPALNDTDYPILCQMEFHHQRSETPFGGCIWSSDEETRFDRQ